MAWSVGEGAGNILGLRGVHGNGPQPVSQPSMIRVELPQPYPDRAARPGRAAESGQAGLWACESRVQELEWRLRPGCALNRARGGLEAKREQPRCDRLCGLAWAYRAGAGPNRAGRALRLSRDVGGQERTGR